jgi:hypothetical protein
MSDRREQFRVTAEEYRGRTRLLTWVFIPLLAAGGLLFAVAGSKHGRPPVVPIPFGDTLGVTLLLFATVGFILGTAFWIPKLRCPECSRSLEDKPDAFCPECGAQALRTGFLGTRCTACGRRLGREKRRYYKVRYCTHCGCHVDDRGL